MTAMMAAPGQRMRGSGGGRTGGFSSSSERLGPPRSGAWTREGGGVEGGERREKAGLDPGVGAEERWGQRAGNFQTIEPRIPPLRRKLGPHALVLPLTWRNSVPVLLKSLCKD